ncbi:MAG: class I SAM-dependent methyltransferase, partial [Candidatus Aureabacteria bacterium]|nr:class I SAM-dependent methyltransferase [Candidatus Auribacterota bacterium]
RLPQRAPQKNPMTTTCELTPTRCAICGTLGNAVELYPANIDSRAFTPEVFSARRLPDRVRYRTVRCTICGLIRSDPAAPSQLLARLYGQSSLTYAPETSDLKRTYGRYLAMLERYGTRKGSLLEIGCGNGFFLEVARGRGYTAVMGVEPSADAAARASAEIRPHITPGVMRPGLFAPNTVDAICMFQVLDHLPAPGEVIDECVRVLKPGGILLCLNHNIEAWSARFLKHRSPIIDIEHTYLFSPSTLSRLLEARGITVLRTGRVYNRYRLHYLCRLIPLPLPLKCVLLNLLARTPFGRIRLAVPLGNMYCIARKP